MGQDSSFVALGETRLQGRTPKSQQPCGFRRYPVDSAHGGALARLAGAISQSGDLLATLTALGGTGSVAENLAHLPVAAGRGRSLGLAGSFH